MLTCFSGGLETMWHYYTTQAVRGPITKINQSKCSIAGPIFSKYWTGHCLEWSCTCAFAFFSRVINLLLTKLASDRTGRISALSLFCTDLAALGPYCQDLGPIFSQYSPRAWLIRYMYGPSAVLNFWLVYCKENFRAKLCQGNFVILRLRTNLSLLILHQ